MTATAKLSLSANLIGLVSPFIGRGDIRYYLDGISVRPAKGGGAIIAATNGHAMAMALDRNAVCEEEVILRVNGHLIQACSAQPHRGRRRLEMRNDRLTVTMGEGPESDLYIQAGNPIIEAKFPDIFRVAPAEETLKPGLAGAFNPTLTDLVSQAARHVRSIKGGKNALMPVQFYTKNADRNEACVARVMGFDEWAAVLMPARATDSELVLPKFIFDKADEK